MNKGVKRQRRRQREEKTERQKKEFEPKKRRREQRQQKIIFQQNFELFQPGIKLGTSSLFKLVLQPSLFLECTIISLLEVSILNMANLEFTK